VKEEVYRVARRYAIEVFVVANVPIRVPIDPLFHQVACPGFGLADDWIAERVGPQDIVITADIPLASRCLERGARVLDSRGGTFTEQDIGAALAMRELMNDLRQDGTVRGGPAPMQPKDRSRFLSKLDETIHALRRSHPSTQ
jgi:uncharacterized protein YaiI (UPF0178 family)